MTEIIYAKKEASIFNTTFILSLLIFFPLIFSCNSKRDLNEPEFKVLEFKLAKGIDDSGEKDIYEGYHLQLYRNQVSLCHQVRQCYHYQE